MSKNASVAVGAPKGITLNNGHRRRKKISSEVVTYNLMMIPGVLQRIIFCIIPLLGVVIAFENYVPAKGVFGSTWVGLENFKFMFLIPNSWKVLRNTVIIAVTKIILNIIVPVVFALLLNEVRHARYKKGIQTVVYLPHFLSWVILGGIFSSMFSLNGVANQIVSFFGGEPTMFLGSNKWFRPIIYITDVWKNFGYGAIIYLAALTGIDPTLYEAAAMDGAGRFKQMLHVTLPGLVPTIILMTTLSLGNVLNAGFDQIFNLYSPLVYETGDIIDTYVYRLGLVDMQYSLSTAVGLMKSLVSSMLIIVSYTLADKLAGYKIF